MQSDDKKSVSSQGSSTLIMNEMENVDQTLPKLQEIFFAILFPLYSKRKRTYAIFELMMWTISSIMILSLGFFRIVGATGLQIIIAIFYNDISTSQPWVITMTRNLVRTVLTVLLVPAITSAITSFDCFAETIINDAGVTISQTSIW
ncbi:MAG: hypothetical protein EZS28_025168 [Streblomastix strix]|uniref:Uncharacterized protein n=1 Tax=Streblomastix strix TaxID=222440 RepID=A0A5J4V9V8_9EUKA|nr:MAG: hypothetical protein EZS28_025168 [Streblomastix strix]